MLGVLSDRYRNQRAGAAPAGAGQRHEPLLGDAMAAQLESLGVAPDRLAPDARALLLSHANGDSQRLYMLLATAAFTAETEDAPLIDLQMAERAIIDQPAPSGANVPPLVAPLIAPLLPRKRQRGRRVRAVHRPKRSFAWAQMLLGACLGALATAAVMASLQRLASISAPHTPPVVIAARSVPPPPTPVAHTVTAARSEPHNAAIPPAPRVSVAAAPQPQNQPVLATVSPPEPNTTGAPIPASLSPPPGPLPIPPGAVPSPAPPPTIARSPRLFVRFYMVSPGAAPRARFIEQRLLAAGMRVTMVADLSPYPPTAPGVVYFHAADADFARTVEAASSLIATPPKLAWYRVGHRVPQGTVELIVP